MKTKSIILYVCCGLIVGLSIGFTCGLKLGYGDGVKHTTEIRNEMLDIQPYDTNLQISDLEYSDISPAGFTVYFNTKHTKSNTIEFDDINGLVCEWAVYPSDIFTISDVKLRVLADPALFAKIEKYPEGGTVMFRIVEQKLNRGSLWFYIDLPRPDDAVLPPPYMPDEDRK